MAEQFYTILTSIGKAKIANASALGNKVNFTHFALGDGGGAYYNPIESQIELKNEVWRGSIGNVAIDEDNPNWIVMETIIPASIGGFMIREAGVFDDEGNLIAIGKYPETYKPVVADGSAKDLYIRMILEVSNTAVVNLKIDPTIILATKKDIDILSNKISVNESEIFNLEKRLGEHEAESANKHIKESGSNANGYYIKYDDGTLICRRNINNAITVPSNSIESIEWIFPAGFNDFPTVLPAAQLNSGATRVTAQIQTVDSILKVAIGVYNGHPSTSMMVGLRLIAIGRWKA